MLRAFLTAMMLAFPLPALADGPLVFAAASLRGALDEVAEAYADAGHPRPVLSYAATSALARQIDQGAPADLVITASADWMDWLAGRNLIDAETQAALLANSLVLIGAAGMPPVALSTDSIEASLAGGRIAMALVEAVPAGQYGKAALTHLGLWQTLSPQVAQTDNVRAALALVARGETPLGIVYATDALAEPRVDVVASFPPGSHPPIRILLAQTTESAHPDADRFHAFLSSPSARAIFDRWGFQ